MNLEEHVIKSGGVKTRCLTAGRGPALVLLHGVGESAVDWEWIIPMLSQDRRVIAPDLPSTTGMDGSGSNGPGSGVQAFETAADVVVSILRELGITRATVVGHSQGGLVAIIMALKYPSVVDALGLVDSAGLGRIITPALRMAAIPVLGEAAIAMSGTPLGALSRAWARSFLLFANPMRAPVGWWVEQYYLAQMPRFLISTLGAIRDGTDMNGQTVVLLDQLPMLSIPVLVIWGELDQIVPAYQARDAYQWLLDGRIAVIQGCGHMPHVESPTECAEALRSFLLSEV